MTTREAAGESSWVYRPTEGTYPWRDYKSLEEAGADIQLAAIERYRNGDEAMPAADGARTPDALLAAAERVRLAAAEQRRLQREAERQRLALAEQDKAVDSATRELHTAQHELFMLSIGDATTA